jgi:hypothetical protein
VSNRILALPILLGWAASVERIPDPKFRRQFLHSIYVG